MMLPTKYFISSILLGMTAIPSILGDEMPMIIGGNDADQGEYPYYVLLINDDEGKDGQCGGTLIAPDMVLTGAQCGDFIEESATYVFVGAYSPENDLGQLRTCERFLPHPDFDADEDGDNDVALCKLNDPVVIDQSSARIELNEDPLFPSAGDDLTVIGFGVTSHDLIDEEYTFPEVLQHVEIPNVSNDVCNDLLSPDTITENMLCAGGTSVKNEGACIGDQGGPLVHIDGGVHTVVGVTSWAVNDCTLVDSPAVYQRVSQHMDWIRDTACLDLGSSADFCTEPEGYPSHDDCGAGNLKLRFWATLVTDDYADETTVSSYSFNQNYTDLDELIFEQTDLEYNTKYYFPSDDEYYCLEKDRCYYFQVTDSYGDGIAPKDNNPVFEGFLGKKRKFKGGKDYDNWQVSPRIFCTGKICEDTKKPFKIGKKKHYCREYVRGGRDRLKRKCNAIAREGIPVHKHCPETCGRKAGVGDCHWWKGMEKALRRAARAFTQTPTPSPIAR